MSVFARVTKQGRKVYWFRFRQDGKEYERSTKQSNEREAIRQEAEFRTRLKEGGIKLADPRHVATLESFTPRFLRFVEHEKGAKRSTLRLYARLLTNLRESRALRSLSLSQINSSAFANYVQERRSDGREGIGFTSIRRERQVLVSLLRYAKEIGEITDLPIIRSPGRQKRRDYVPDEEAIRAYLAGAAPLLRDAAILSLSTGMRPGEILALSPSQIAERSGGFTITLAESKSEAGKKPIHVSRSNARAACDVLAARLAANMFADAPGRDTREKVEKLSKLHTRLRKRLKLPAEFVFYSWRHLYVTHAAPGTEAHELRELARHQDIKTTLLYYSPQERERQRAAARVKLPKLPAVKLLKA